MAKKHRSPSYPAIDLEAAVALVRKSYPQAKHFLGGDVLAELWGYKSLVSAAPYVAAMKQYGFLFEDLVSPDRMLQLSELALDVAVDPDGTTNEYRDAIQEAWLNPKLYKELYSKWGDELPPDGEIRRYLERERDFNPNYVSRFINNFKASMAFAREAMGTAVAGKSAADSRDNGSDHEELDEFEIQVGSYVQWSSQGVDQFPVPQKVVGIDGDYAFVECSQTGLPMSELTLLDPPAASQHQKTPPSNPFFKPAQQTEDVQRDGIALDRTTLDEGAVRLEWPDTLSKESVEEFEYWLTGVLNRARRKAGMDKVKVEEVKKE
jgi:hypothetical protein